MVSTCPANGGDGAYAPTGPSGRTGLERELAGHRAGGEEATAAGLEARVAKRAAAEPLRGFRRAFAELGCRRTKLLPAVQQPLTVQRVGFWLAAESGGPVGLLPGPMWGEWRQAVAPG